MYYFLLTILIISVFIIHKKFKLRDRLKNIKILKDKRENFAQPPTAPSPTSQDSTSSLTPSPLTTSPTPTPSILNKLPKTRRTKIGRKVPNNLKVLRKFVSPGQEVELSLDLVYLEPKYHFEKSTYLYGKKNTFENLEWKQEFTKDICQNERGKCACYKMEDGEEICGVEDNKYIYECANPCQECDKCHLRRGKIQLQYIEYCNKAINEQDKERCEKYKERVLLSKKNCFFSENNNTKLIKEKEKCKIFLPARYNSYLSGEDIIFKVNLKYQSPKIRNMVDYIKIQDLRIDDKGVPINEFYNSKDEIYLFFNSQDKHQGLNKIIKINGTIFFKKNLIPKIEFTNKNVVNIFSQYEEDENNLDKELNREDIINSKISESLEPKKKRVIESVDEDRFSNNYLGENRYFMCQKSSNYTVKNPIKNSKNGEFKPKKILDNPYSWKQRADINRPWDYIIQ